MVVKNIIITHAQGKWYVKEEDVDVASSSNALWVLNNYAAVAITLPMDMMNDIIAYYY